MRTFLSICPPLFLSDLSTVLNALALALLRSNPSFSPLPSPPQVRDGVFTTHTLGGSLLSPQARDGSQRPRPRPRPSQRPRLLPRPKHPSFTLRWPLRWPLCSPFVRPSFAPLVVLPGPCPQTRFLNVSKSRRSNRQTRLKCAPSTCLKHAFERAPQRLQTHAVDAPSMGLKQAHKRAPNAPSTQRKR